MLMGIPEEDQNSIRDAFAMYRTPGQEKDHARVGLVQERRFLSARAPPVVDEIDAPAVREREARDVDRIAESVLGEARAGHIVDAPAAIGAEHVDGRDPLPEAGLSVWLDDSAEPGLERRDHRTVDGERLVDRDRTFGERRHLERTRHAADARAVDLGRGDDRVGERDLPAGEAGLFGLRSPDRPLGTAEESATRQTWGRDKREHNRRNATRHGAKLEPIGLRIAEPCSVKIRSTMIGPRAIWSPHFARKEASLWTAGGGIGEQRRWDSRWNSQ